MEGENEYSIFSMNLGSKRCTGKAMKGLITQGFSFFFNVLRKFNIDKIVLSTDHIPELLVALKYSRNVNCLKNVVYNYYFPPSSRSNLDSIHLGVKALYFLFIRNKSSVALFSPQKNIESAQWLGFWPCHKREIDRKM